MSKKLVFFGTEDFSASSLHRLVAAEYDVVAIVTKPDSKAGRGQQIKESRVAHIAKVATIKTLRPEKLTNINKELKALKPDYGVLVAYGKIIPQDIIDIFPAGIINVHPSLLPKYRGPSPIESTILNGDKVTGVSLMKLTAGMDEGPIYAQKEVDTLPKADRTLLSSYLAEFGADLLLEKLPDIISRRLKPKPQNDSQAIYTKLLKKEDGLIDWSKSAEQIERRIRAFRGWPRSRTKLHGQDIIVTKAQVAKDENDGQLVVKCGSSLPAGRQGYLEIKELIAPSGRSMSGADFLRGYKR